jgi:Holliday junction resolvase
MSTGWLYWALHRRSNRVAATPEKKVKDRVVSLLKAHGAYYFFPATHGMGRSGVPDIICCHRGRFLGIECKAGKNKPTELQLYELERILAAGGEAMVVNETNINDVSDMLHRLEKDAHDRSH